MKPRKCNCVNGGCVWFGANELMLTSFHILSSDSMVSVVSSLRRWKRALNKAYETEDSADEVWIVCIVHLITNEYSFNSQ